MGQGKANIQILCYERSTGASLRLESEHLSGNILQERKVMPAWSASSWLLQGILPSPLNCVQGMHSNKRKKKYCPFVERKIQ